VSTAELEQNLVPAWYAGAADHLSALVDSQDKHLRNTVAGHAGSAAHVRV
jgi:hypothetical protein